MQILRWLMVPVLTVLAALAIALAVPRPSQADVVYGSTVSAPGATPYFTAYSGLRNTIDVWRDATGCWVRESNPRSIWPGSGCPPPGAGFRAGCEARP